MTNFRSVFTTRHTFLPVIHVEDFQQAHRNVSIALEAGCSGVFLISHTDLCNYERLARITTTIRALFPDLWIGVNFLDITKPTSALEMAKNHGANGLWVDNPRIIEGSTEQPEAETVKNLSNSLGLCYFGGVAFKYQSPVENLEDMTKLATSYVDVVTTSGEGTGQAADIVKIKTMKAAIGSFPLAIASGITPENIADYREHADCFLVASGIGKTFTEFDPEKITALASQLELK